MRSLRGDWPAGTCRISLVVPILKTRFQVNQWLTLLSVELGEPDPERWITPQLKILKGGFAQGSNANEIICRLMDDLVPLSHPRGSGGGRHSPIRRKKAYTHIKENLESRLGKNYSQFIPEDPRVKTGVGIDLYLPFRRGEGVAEAATLVSADYTSKEKVQGELYLGLRDVSLSREKAGFRNGSIFIVRPGGNMKRDVLRQAEEELREFALYLDSCNVEYYQGRELDELSEMVAEWIDEAAA